MYLKLGAEPSESRYRHLGRVEPAPRVTRETPGPVTLLPITRVLDTTLEPFRSICRIHVRTTKNGNSFGTGVLISRHHVLTCAHILYPRQNPNPREVTVLPGQSGPDDKRPQVRANGWAVSPGWRWFDCETDTRDFAIVRLSRPADVPVWPIAPFDYSLFSYALAAHLAGYPALREDPKAQRMFESRGRVLGGIHVLCCCDPTPQKRARLTRAPSFTPIRDSTQLIAHDMDSRVAMSGGPVWVFWEGKRVLVAIHAGDIDDGARRKAVLLNSAVRQRITEMITRTLPPLPAKSS